MSGEDGVDAFDRVARQVGGTDVIDRLAALSGSDFTTVMLEVVRRRAAGDPGHRPAPVPARPLRPSWQWALASGPAG